MPSITDLPNENEDGSICVYTVRARVYKKKEINALLEPIPDADEIRRTLKRPGVAHSWDPVEQVHYWVCSDGRRAMRLTFEGLSERQAKRTWRLFSERFKSAGHYRIDWIPTILHEVTGRSPPPSKH